MKVRHHSTLIILLTLAFGMLALTFSSSALFRMFCEKTGHGGTTQVAKFMPNRVEDRVITVRFNADTHTELPWDFRPLQREIKVKVGEVGLAFYHAKSLSSAHTSGMATYNVTPHKAGIYFNKVECFCFIEQHLEGGQESDFPVQFFINPDIVEDPTLDDIHTITLSYTFFRLKKAGLAQK
ncbi:MAG: cytochrome c oxidase assembly protein [Alphaproteobacteria bacterium]|nr:cytochrome c oxidase assembly protein [Alphaproteobacteria bacterium]